MALSEHIEEFSQRLIFCILVLISITLICFWTLSLLIGENSYEITQIILKSLFGKFIIVFLCWSFSFHILNEIRHFISNIKICNRNLSWSHRCIVVHLKVNKP